MVRDLRYILKRVIIGILIGLFFLLFRTRLTFATTLSNVTARVYFQTQNCTKVDNAFNCSNGTNYRFMYSENTDNSGLSNLMPIILNNSENYVYFKNMILSLDFETPVTTNSTTDRYISYNFNSGNYITPNTTTYGELFFVPNLLSTYGLYNDQRDNKLLSYSTYSFKPHYCTYEDTNHNTGVCGIIYDHSSGTAPDFSMAFDIPTGTSVTNVTLYIGNFDMSSSYNAYTLQSYSPAIYVPASAGFEFYDTNVPGQSNLIYYGRRYNTYRTTANDQNNKGLIFLKQGTTYVTPNFHVPTGLNNVVTMSRDLSSNLYQYHFSYSTEIQNTLQGIIPSINEELDAPQQEDEDATEMFENMFNDFGNNYSGAFSSLFSSIFTYPFYRFSQLKDIDLVRTNVNGTTILNDLICTANSGENNITGAYNPYTIELGFGYSFKLPCPHTEIYPKLKARGYGFYGNSFKGAQLTTGVTYDFATIWLTLQHGLLIYFMFVECLNIYKYVLDANKCEVEVIEL